MSVAQHDKSGKDALLHPCPLPLLVSRRASPGNIEQECLSPAAAFRRVGPAPLLDSTVELALDVGIMGESAPKGITVGQPALLLVCWVVEQIRRKYPLPLPCHKRQAEAPDLES